jgi:two-component system response regulator YesN
MHKVVIIDDEPMICRWMMEKISWQEWSCEVVGIGKNGLEGKELVDTHKPDIVISDVKMPGLNGLELSQYIHINHPQTLVLILSGYSEFDYVRSAMRNHVFDYFLKPLDMSAFRDTMNKVSNHLKEFQDYERETELSEQKLIESTLLSESGILMNLIMNGNKELGGLRAKMQRIGLSVNKGQIAVYELHRIHDPELEKSKSIYQYAVQNILQETFQRQHWTAHVLFIENKCVVVAKQTSDMLMPIWEKKLLEAAIEGAENVKFFLKLKISFGIGAVFKSIDELHSSYHSAIESLESQYFWTRETVSSRNYQDSSLIGSPFAVGLELYEKIEKGDEQLAVDCLKSIVAKLKHSGSKDFVYSACTEILIHLSKIAETWEKEIDFLPLVNNIKQYRDFEELIQVIEQVVQSLCRSIDEKRTYANASLMGKIKLHIEEHYDDQDMNLTKIAEDFHISLSHLSRMFSKTMQLNFNEHLTKIRLESAKKMMVEKYWLNNREIAEQVGFSDGRYFSQVFKKHNGKTPKEYKDSVKK